MNKERKVVAALETRGIYTLNQLAVQRPVDPWIQHWKNAALLGLEEPVAAFLNHYISGLNRAQIHLSDKEDKLIWELDPAGIYTPKMGYSVLSAGDMIGDEVWWWRPLWKLKCPSKNRLFMWCALMNRVPTWDNLQKRNFQGPGWCVLCKNDLETIPHLFIHCQFSTAVWKECSKLMGFDCKWEGNSVDIAWEHWWGRTTDKKQKTLPLLIIWGIWLARNGAIFQEKSCIPELLSANSVGIYQACPEHIRAANQRRDLVVEIDKSSPWGFFDGAASNEICGGGAILYISDSHFYTLTMGLGAGTNNFAEVISLKLLLIFANERGIARLAVFGDSMNAINWTNQTQACRVLRIANVINTIQLVKQSFETFICRHVYRENNKLVDQASKDGQLMVFGTWKVTEELNGQRTEFFHRPFIE